MKKSLLDQSKRSNGTLCLSESHPSRLKSLIFDNHTVYPKQEEYHERSALKNDLNYSEFQDDSFHCVWKKYVKLLANNGKFLFDDGEKSKDKFCHLLHSQIDISNKLVMKLSQIDDKRFLEFSQQMGNSTNLKNPLLPAEAEEPTNQQNNLSNIFALPTPNEKNPFTFPKFNPGLNQNDDNKLMANFPKVQETFQKNTPSIYENIKSYLFDLQEVPESQHKVFPLRSDANSVKSYDRNWDLMDASSNGKFNAKNLESGKRSTLSRSHNFEENKKA